MKKSFVGCVGVGADLTICWRAVSVEVGCGRLEHGVTQDAQIIKEREGEWSGEICGRRVKT
jgi:hypothetical protein